VKFLYKLVSTSIYKVQLKEGKVHNVFTSGMTSLAD